MRPDPLNKTNADFRRSFAAALHGLLIALLVERNLRIHIAAAVLALCLTRFYSFSRGEWAALLLCIGLVLVAELLNTAVEYAVDLYTDHQYNAVAGASKDVAAGAVFVSALVSAGVGLVLFWQREPFAAVLADLRAHPLRWLAFAAAAAVWIVLPGRGKRQENEKEQETK